MAHTCSGALALTRRWRCGEVWGLWALRARTLSLSVRHKRRNVSRPTTMPLLLACAQARLLPTVDAWRHNRSSTGAQAHDHAAFSPRPPREPGNTLTATARQRGMQGAEKTPGRSGGSQRRACTPGLEVSLRELTQRCFLQLCLSQQLFEARVLLAQLTQFLDHTMIHRPITLGPPAQRRPDDTQHAASLGPTNALTSQRLGLLQLHDNLLRHVLRKLPHGHPFSPATSSRDYSEQPSHNKRSEKLRPLHYSTISFSSKSDEAVDHYVGTMLLVADGDTWVVKHFWSHNE